jgi:hypothetical protein
MAASRSPEVSVQWSAALGCDAKLSVRASDAQEKAALEEGLKETAIDDGITLVYLVELNNA